MRGRREMRVKGLQGDRRKREEKRNTRLGDVRRRLE